MTPPYVNLNGRLLPTAEARIGILDHGLLYGDGLFETLRVSYGALFRPHAHLSRLFDGCRRLALTLPWTRQQLEAALQSVVEANGIRDGALRLTVTRGEGPPLPDPSRCPEPAFFVTAREWKPAATPPAWTAAITGAHPRTFIPGIKTLSYLPFQQARVAARARGCDEAILTYEGQVVEAGTSNLFAVREGRLHTPDLLSGCLPGIAREILLDLAREAGLEPCEAPLPTADLLAAEEVLASNSLLGPVPLLRIDDRAIGSGAPGPATARLIELYADLVRSVCKP